MTTTRRQSKVAEQEATEDQHPLALKLPDDIDKDVLCRLLPSTHLTSISAEDVVALYRLVVMQVITLDVTERERDDARAELERKEVELDQALQDKESLSKELEVDAEASNEEFNKLKQDRDHLGCQFLYLLHSFKRSYIFRGSGSQWKATRAAHNYVDFSILCFD
jgi:nucleoprotein TPR